MSRLTYFATMRLFIKTLPFLSIRFHLVREAVAAEKIIVDKVDSKDNLADLLTKSVLAHRRKYLRSKIMFSEDKEW